MKLSTILALALATYTTLATAQNNDFRPKNADEAERLTEEFKKLTPDSSCQDGEQACVNDQFAQCVGGKFQLTACASGLKCCVLPLVNKPGTSITCDTEADRQARLDEARGGQNPKSGKSKTIVEDPSETGKGKSGGDTPQQPEPQPDQSQDPKVFRPKNADEAEKLTEDFKKLTPDSSCQDGEQACVNDQFAQCVGGKFQLTACASGLKCCVLPLVNKPGTSITCDTEADRQARLDEARGQNPKSSPKSGKSKTIVEEDPSGTGKGKSDDTPQQPDQQPDQSGDPKVFRPKNADEAEKLTEDFKKLTPDSSCQDGEQACVNDQFAQCVGGKFQLTACASGLKCCVLPLVNKPGTSITCDTEADRQARLDEARGQNPPKRRSPQSDSQDPNVFRPKNADEAEKLTEEFKKLTPDSSCQNGEQACVNDQFAQCVGGKFQLTACASGLKCCVLPLVNKPGTSITCDTEADRQARLAEARGQNPSKRRSVNKRKLIKRSRTVHKRK